ncbi:hypothetical protein [Dongia sp.]|uniref:hypothetical protein n=1 Tax=Dongia sp. TaxID=1977262 RepID=UPI0037535F5C
MKAALLALAACVLCSAESAQAEDFSVGGFTLSRGIEETLKTGGEAWDDEGNHRKWRVTKESEEPVSRYSIFVSTGKLGEPHAEHHIAVYATDQHQAFLMDFRGALDSNVTTQSRDFVQICADDVAKLGGAARTALGVTLTPGLGSTLSIIVDRDMPPAARTRTLAALDAYLGGSGHHVELTQTLKFKALAAALGPDFRGAIVQCGYQGGMEPYAVWNTRFLDLPLAATIFNLDPE